MEEGHAVVVVVAFRLVLVVVEEDFQEEEDFLEEVSLVVHAVVLHEGVVIEDEVEVDNVVLVDNEYTRNKFIFLSNIYQTIKQQ